jgi:hypothetical protein
MDKNQTIQEMVGAAQGMEGAAPDDAMEFLAEYVTRNGSTMAEKDRQEFIQAGATLWLLWQT